MRIEYADRLSPAHAEVLLDLRAVEAAKARGELTGRYCRVVRDPSGRRRVVPVEDPSARRTIDDGDAPSRDSEDRLRRLEHAAAEIAADRRRQRSDVPRMPVSVALDPLFVPRPVSMAEARRRRRLRAVRIEQVDAELGVRR
jgi:hypothetical protein